MVEQWEEVLAQLEDNWHPCTRHLATHLSVGHTHDVVEVTLLPDVVPGVDDGMPEECGMVQCPDPACSIRYTRCEGIR